MKYKSFRYNEIIKFFPDNNLPLTRQQIELIASKVREEVDAIDIRIEKRKSKRMDRRETRTKLGYSRIGLNNV